MIQNGQIPRLQNVNADAFQGGNAAAPPAQDRAAARRSRCRKMAAFVVCGLAVLLLLGAVGHMKRESRRLDEARLRQLRQRHTQCRACVMDGNQWCPDVQEGSKFMDYEGVCVFAEEQEGDEQEERSHGGHGHHGRHGDDSDDSDDSDGRHGHHGHHGDSSDDSDDSDGSDGHHGHHSDSSDDSDGSGSHHGHHGHHSDSSDDSDGSGSHHGHHGHHSDSSDDSDGSGSHHGHHGHHSDSSDDSDDSDEDFDEYGGQPTAHKGGSDGRDEEQDSRRGEEEQDSHHRRRRRHHGRRHHDREHHREHHHHRPEFDENGELERSAEMDRRMSQCNAATMVTEVAQCHEDEPLMKTSCTMCTLDAYVWVSFEDVEHPEDVTDDLWGKCVSHEEAAEIEKKSSIKHDDEERDGPVVIRDFDGCPAALRSNEGAHTVFFIAHFVVLAIIVALLVRCCVAIRRRRQQRAMQNLSMAPSAPPSVPMVPVAPVSIPSQPPASSQAVYYSTNQPTYAAAASSSCAPADEENGAGYTYPSVSRNGYSRVAN